MDTWKATTIGYYYMHNYYFDDTKIDLNIVGATTGAVWLGHDKSFPKANEPFAMRNLLQLKHLFYVARLGGVVTVSNVGWCVEAG
jgi:hypothetical protein